MNGLTRFLDWLDEAAGALIRVTYLLAGITAVAVYFGAGHLPPVIEDPLNAALPWLLGFSLETHTYLTARRVRAAYQERNWGALKVQLGVLAGLLAFSAWNQLQYLALTWQPPTTGALALPTWAAFLVRALIVPAAFMAAAFLAPLAEPVTAQIEAEARATLADVFKIARKQRRRMLKRAEADGRDMTGALVELVPDPEVRRIIGHAYGAIRAPLMDSITPAIAAPAPDALPTPTQEAAGVASEAQPPVDTDTPSEAATASRSTADGDDETPPKPPTGPGSPSRKRGVRTPRRERVPVLRLEQPPEWRRTAAQAGGAGTHSRRVRTGQSREADARAAWADGAHSVTAMERKTGMSRATAAKWVKMLQAEEKRPSTDASAVQ